MEIYYLDKLIKFKSPSFDTYIKRLEELKKKLRNETGEEDEDKNNGDMDMELGSKKNSQQNDDDNNNKKTKKEKEDEKKRKRKEKNNKRTKILAQKNKKKKIMSKYFFRSNLFFTFEVIGVFVVSVTYYLVIMLVEKSKKNDYLNFDSNTNSIENIYKSSFDIFLQFKTQLAVFENNISDIKNAFEAFDSDDTLEYYTINFTQYTRNQIEEMEKYTMNVPSSSDITTPKLGNLLMSLTNSIEGNSKSSKELNQLYNENACKILFKDNENITLCTEFWDTIITSGMEQAITQMSVIISTVIDEMNELNECDKTICSEEFENFIKNGSFHDYEVFVEFYLLESYLKTVDIFESFRKSTLKNTKKLFKMILFCYIGGSVILFFILLYFVYRSKFVFNSFLNFIGIFPVTYLMEDDGLYKDVLKLEQSIY